MAEVVRDLDLLGQSLFETDVYHAVTFVSVLDGFKSHDARARVGKKFKTSPSPEITGPFEPPPPPSATVIAHNEVTASFCV